VSTVFQAMGKDLIRRAGLVRVPLSDFYGGLRDIRDMLDERLALGKCECPEREWTDTSDRDESPEEET